MRPINPHRDQWITALTADQELSTAAIDVGQQLAAAARGLSLTSFTSWRGIWQQLPHLTRRDVLTALWELEKAGYVAAAPYGQPRLTLPAAA